MAFDTTAASGILKEFYLPRVRDQINNKVKALAVFERGSEDIEGSEVVLSLRVQRHNGIGARAEGSALPAAGSSAYTKERTPTYNLYARMSISGKVIEAAATDRGSFTRSLESQTTTLQEDARRDYARQIWGTADGVLVSTGVTSASTTVVLATATTATQLRFMEVGKFIDIGTVAAPTGVASNRQITSVNTAAKTIVISGAAVTTATTDRIFITGNGGAAGGVGQKEITGIPVIVDDTGTLFNVNPTTYPVWKSYEDSTGGLPSDALIEKMLMEVEIASGEEANYLWVSDGVYRSYAATMKSQKRFPDTVKLKGGFSGLSVSAGGAETTLMWDRDVPSGCMFAVNSNHIKFHEMADWNWLERDNSMLHYVTGYDEYEAVLYKYTELATDARNTHGKLTGLTEG